MPIFIERIADPIAADFNDLVKIYSDYPLHGSSAASGDELNHWLREQLSAPQITLYAARFNGRLLGALWIHKNKQQASWALEHLCVRGLTRRRGVADKLIGEVLLYAEQAGAKVIIPISRTQLDADLLDSLDGLTQRYRFEPSSDGNAYTWQADKA